MTGWLMVNGFLHSSKFDELAEMFHAAAVKYGIRLQTIKNSECLVALDGENSAVRDIHGNRERPDFVIFWDKDILLAEYLETMGIPVFNSSKCIAVCDDKRKTHLALYRSGIAMPRTIFAPMTYNNIGYPENSFLDEIEKTLPYPIVIKEARGSFGEQVYLAQNRQELEMIVRERGSKELLFQEFVSTSRGRDVRLQVVGDCVTGAMYRHSETDFRANITAGGKMRAYEPSGEEISLARKAAEAVGADFAGVDLLFGPDGPVVCEVNSNAHFKNLMDCSGINTAEAILEYASREAVSR